MEKVSLWGLFVKKGFSKGPKWKNYTFITCPSWFMHPEPVWIHVKLATT
jgi:hypothetical protein